MGHSFVNDCERLISTSWRNSLSRQCVRICGAEEESWLQRRWFDKNACGEHEYTEHGFKVLVGLGSADILQPDITWCGGTTAGRRISAIVEDAGLELIPHRGASSWGFPIALTSPSCTMAESFPEGSAILDAMSCQVENGYVVAPTKPGFGHSLTEKMVLDFQLTRRI